MFTAVWLLSAVLLFDVTVQVGFSRKLFGTSNASEGILIIMKKYVVIESFLASVHFRAPLTMISLASFFVNSFDMMLQVFFVVGCKVTLETLNDLVFFVPELV